MKFLICGLGSIGQRHVRMIRQVMGDTADIAAYRSRRLDVVISDALDATFGTRPEEHYSLHSFYDLKEALAWKPDAVFVTNPISLHVPTALQAARAGCHLFIEKPVAHDDGEVTELARLVHEKRLVCMVGYQLRYHPAYLKVRELLAAEAIGRVTSVDLHFGEWLPGMHPYEDYRDSHTVRKDQGGGVILCLSHEVDLACWLFGKPRSVYAAGGHLSDLEMDVEDTADIILTCGAVGREFPVHIHLDFLQKPPRRYAHIVGEKGTIHVNYIANTCEICRLPNEAKETIMFTEFQRNDMFFQEVSTFIRSVKARGEAPISLDDGIATLAICLAARRSIVSGRVEYVT